jgi:hypothetical protein
MLLMCYKFRMICHFFLLDNGRKSPRHQFIIIVPLYMENESKPEGKGKCSFLHMRQVARSKG